MVPANWRVARLSDVVACQGGSAFAPSLQGRARGAIPFYKVSDMNLPENQWGMSRANNYVEESDAEKISGQRKRAGSVIFPKVGAAIHTNKKRLLLVPAFVDNNVMAVWPLDPASCHPAFLFHYFQTVELSQLSSPGPLPSINASRVYEREIAIPPLPEQEKIAAVLWKIQRAIEVEEKLIATARELKQAAMRQLFTRGLRGEPLKESEVGPIPESWRVCEFAKLREFLQYGTSAKCDYLEKGNPVVRIPNVFDGRINNTDLKWCELSDKEIDSLRLEPGDVLFIRTNGVRDRVGTCAVYAGIPERALFASYLIRARLNGDLDPAFFQYFTDTPAGISFLGGRASPAADGKFNVNTKLIDAVCVPLPDIAEQREIVHALKTIDRKIALHERKRSTLQELFKTMLHQLMTGQIRVDKLDIDVSEVRS